MRRRRLLFVIASLTLVPLAGLLSVRAAFCLTSQNVPGADLPTTNPSPGTASKPAGGGVPSAVVAQPSPDSNITPQPSPAAETDTPGQNPVGDDTDSQDLGTEQEPDTSGTDQEAGTSESEPTSADATPPPALDAGVMKLGPDLGNESLDSEIGKATVPALAASLRLTENARKSLGDSQVDEAMRELARAVSLDPSNAFAYYYLARAYLVKKNYSQALTFFRRAEIGFNGRADWAAEALSYEGLCDEELGRPIDALKAYKDALAASPDNFKARVGYGRLASIAGPLENVDAPPPDQDLAIPPPDQPDESAPPEEPPPPPPAE
jgi:TolA-binding protein